MNNKSQRTPLIDPLLIALKSRRVIIAIISLAVGIFILAVPEFAPMRQELLTLLTTLALALIGGYTVEDAVQIARQSQPTETEVPEQLKDLIESLIDEILQARE